MNAPERITPLAVYTAICAVQADLAKHGITKDRRNQQQGYSFRGIDDVYNALSPLLAEHRLCILPRILTRHCEERQSSKGGTLFYVTVEAEFDFVSADDGSKHVVRTFGEAMDSADKATNKAMSAAYKYAAFQAFAIPTEGDNDADGNTPTPKAKGEKKPDSPPPAPGMAPKQITHHRDQIGAATDKESLAAAMRAGMEAAHACDDKAAYDAIKECGEKRAEKLGLPRKTEKPATPPADPAGTTQPTAEV